MTNEVASKKQAPPLTDEMRARADAVVNGQMPLPIVEHYDDGPGEEDGPWAEDWERRSGVERRGVKADHDKSRLDLVSTIWLFGVGEVLAYGAKKYAAHNWRKGLARSRLLGACLRHVLAYVGGEDNDPETGMSHLYHASCCLMFAAELHQTQPETDDRWKS